MATHWPTDGKPVSLAALKKANLEDADDTFEGLEFWSDEYGWRDGGLASWASLDDDESLSLFIDDDLDRGREVEISGGVILRPNLMATDVLAATPPKAGMEYYLFQMDEFVRAEEIEVDENGDWYFAGTRVAGPDNQVPERPHLPPAPFDGLSSSDLGSGTKQIKAGKLLPFPSFQSGGYEVYDPENKTWHVIEELYQDDPDEEVMELIADGLHWSHLDTSEDLTIRRRLRTAP
jgi:hypothetical protein